MKEIETYKAGQLVYTVRNIHGWFDKSIKLFIPTNTPCTILTIQLTPDTAKYLVRFNDKFSEFGDYTVSHFDLRLG